MDLLNKLDSIQSDDPMIRDSKRSVSRELIRFMDYLDDLSIKRHQLLSRVVKNVKIGGTGTKSRVFQSDQRTSIADCNGLKGEVRELLEKLRKWVEKIEGFSEEYQEKDVELENPRTYTNGKPAVSQIITGVLKKRHAGVQAKTKKNVSFADSVNVYMVYRSSNWPNPNGESNSIDGSDSIDAEELGRGVAEIGTGDDDEELHTDDNESPQISDDDRDPRSDLIENDDGSFVFSAPLPVKIRADMRSKKKSLKILN